RGARPPALWPKERFLDEALLGASVPASEVAAEPSEGPNADGAPSEHTAQPPLRTGGGAASSGVGEESCGSPDRDAASFRSTRARTCGRTGCPANSDR